MTFYNHNQKKKTKSQSSDQLFESDLADGYRRTHQSHSLLLASED